MNIFNKKIEWIECTLILLITLTPIFSFGEIGQLFSNSNGYSQSEVKTPIYIKAIKDILVILLMIILFCNILLKKNINIIAANGLLIICLIVFPVFFWSFYHNPLIAISGLRWLVNIVVALLLIGYVKLEFISKFSNVLFYIFIIHIFMQFMEMFFGIQVHGVRFFGLPSRVPGIFIIPNTAGFFSVMVFFFSYYYLQSSRKRRIIYILSPLSIFITASATALAILIFSVFYMKYQKKYKKIIPVLLLIVVIILYFSLGFLTGRGNVIGESLGLRLAIFLDVFDDVGIFSSTFGAATQTAVLMSANMNIPGDTYFTDSTFGSILANVGIFGFSIFLFFYFKWIYLTYRSKNEAVMVFTMIYSGFALTTSVTEAFPMNILFSILMAYYIPGIFSKIRKLEKVSSNDPAIT